ncbi:unnamed protein product [Lactuca saligna]|uniref:Uncharacterized protein n=1 Tax=Lactuca saligna TaxID=75948 RepID=A0AA35Z921_LACSI|nr:unnamed protein product [Lactuca saligna]
MAVEKQRMPAVDSAVIWRQAAIDWRSGRFFNSLVDNEKRENEERMRLWRFCPLFFKIWLEEMRRAKPNVVWGREREENSLMENSVSGNLNYATSQTPSGHGSYSFHVAPLKLIDALSINIDEDDYLSNHTSEHFTQPPPSADSPSGNPNKRAKPSNPRPRAPSASPKPLLLLMI